MLRHARPAPERFDELAGELFRVMASGGRVGFETVAWFNGGLFDDGAVLPLEKSDIDTVLAASNLDWSEIDPSILGTLFERGLDPGKRAQLGAHYTDRDKIMLLVEPVVRRPWLAEWAAEKTEITAELDRAATAKSRAARIRRHKEAERRLRGFLARLRAFTVLDPACGSGNFLYLALQALVATAWHLKAHVWTETTGRGSRRLRLSGLRRNAGANRRSSPQLGRRTQVRPLSAAGYASNDWPHPHVDLAVGFLMVNPPPVRLSTKSTSAPLR